MKKFLWLIVCLMTMISVNAQDDIIRGVDGVSKERFFNCYGSDFEEHFTKAYLKEHLSSENLKCYDVKYRKIKEVAVRKFKRTLIAPSQFVLSNIYGDNITANDLHLTEFKENGEKRWSVFVTGDAKNRIGGYVHINHLVDVYGSEKEPY